MKRKALLPILLGWALVGCTRSGTDEVQAASSNSDPVLSVTPGTKIRVRLNETIDTRRNRAGDRFTASLDEPLVTGDRVVVPKGANFYGRVTQAKSSGRFKGRAILAVRLDGFELNGRTYELQAAAAARASSGHKKRNWTWIGGGSGGGAAIGALAGGGMGALIGAGAGAAAGTAGAAITGKKQVTLPAETVLTFTLESPVQLGQRIG